MRVQMRLSRPAVVAMQKYKIIKFNDPNAKVTSGYLVGMAWKSIKSKAVQIDWPKVNSAYIPNVTDNNDMSIDGLQTALNLEMSVLQDIEYLQKKFIDIFETKKIFKPFVIKLILFAAILGEQGTLYEKTE